MGQEFPSDYGLQSYWSCNTLPEIPDNVAGTTYVQDAWATTDSWTGVGGASLSVSGGKLICTAGAAGYAGAYRSISSITNGIVRVKLTASTTRSVAFVGTIGGVGNTLITNVALNAGETKVMDVYVAGALTLIQIYQSSRSIGDTLTIDWVYIGSGLYDTLLIDNSGNAKNATVYGACPQPGKNGNGLLFNGVFNRCTYSTVAKTTATFSVWVRFTSTSSDMRIIQENGGSGAYVRSAIIISSQKAALVWRKDVSTGDNLIGTNNINDGVWHHVAGVWDTATVYLYVDGVLDKTKSSTLYSITPDVVGTIGSNPAASIFYNGYLDEPRIYSRALSANDVYLLYTTIVRPTYPAIAPSVESNSTQASIFVVNSTASGFALTSTIDNYENLLFERSFASIGHFSFSILADSPQAQYVKVNSFIIVSSAYGQPQKRVGIILSVDRAINEDSKKTLNVTGFEAKGIFAWRVLVPLAGYPYFSYDDPQPAETIFKIIARYQGGVDSEDSLRKFSGLTVAPNLLRGASYIFSERYTNAAAVMERLALASKIGWAITWTGAGLLFDIIYGKDRTLGNGVYTPAILSTEFDTIRESHFVSDETSYKSLNYVGGQGIGVSRTIRTRYIGDGVPSNLARKEIFTDARDLSTDARLDSRGDEVLASTAYTAYVSAIVNPNSLFVKSSGADLGDYITVQSFGYQMTSQIMGITEQWGANGYEIEYALDRKPATLTTVISNEASKLTRLSTGMES